MSASFYLIVESDNSKNKEYYPDNELWKFKVRFDTPLNLSGFWTVALTDVLIRDSSKTTYVGNLYVHCSVAGESILNEERRESLLRVLHFVKRGNWTHKYSTLYYVNVNKSLIFEMEFYITNRQSEYASFLKQPVTLALHFRQYPFFAWKRWMHSSYTFLTLPNGLNFTRTVTFMIRRGAQFGGSIVGGARTNIIPIEEKKNFN